jgi:hypothetical protein
MKIRNILRGGALSFMALFGCATPAVIFVSPTYPTQSVQRVAVLGFTDFNGQPGSGTTVADVFEKYLFNLHYVIIDPSQAQVALQGKSLNASGNLDASALATLGKTLNVDAVVSGSLSDYAQTSEQTVMVNEPQEETDPIYQTVTVQGRHGNLRTITQQVGTQTTFVDQSVPETETLPARVGLSARLVSVKTGELLWSGSASADGSNLSSAAENASTKITQALQKAIEKSTTAAHP